MTEEVSEKNKDAESEVLKIPHHRGNDYSSHYATGIVLTGPTPDDLYQMHFFIETFGIKSETAVHANGDEENVFQLSIGKDDLVAFREDKSRISVTSETLLKLRDIIDRHLTRDEKKEVADD